MRFRRCTAAKPHHRRSHLSALGEQHLTPPYGADPIPLLAKLRASIDGLPRKVASQGPEKERRLPAIRTILSSVGAIFRRNPADLRRSSAQFKLRHGGR